MSTFAYAMEQLAISNLVTIYNWRLMMKTRLMIPGVLLLFLGTSIPTLAQESGKRDYLVYCSSCHGVDGRGNGPAVKVIPGFKPSDLTTLAKRNNGQFPEDEVRNIIDGRKALPGHNDFDTDMPLWGLQFQEEGKQFTAESEAKVKRRIDALVAYIRSIQRE